MKLHYRWPRLLFLFLFTLLLWEGAAAQSGSPVTYTRYDVTIELQEDGTFHVREEQQIRFEDSFRTAFAEIPLDYVSDIQNVTLGTPQGPFQEVSGEPAAPGTYSVNYEANAIFVDWVYEPTVAGEERTFILEYDVLGGLWVYEDGDILEWRAVPEDRSGVPVLQSTVTVRLPQEVGAESLQADAFGPSFTTETDGQQVTFTATEPIEQGTAFQVLVGFPHGLVQAQVQPWQRREDSAELAYSIPQVETELHIAEDGTVQVTERQRVAVDAGVLYEGQRIIPLTYVDGITGLGVYEGEQSMRFVSGPEAACEYCAWTQERPRSPNWVSVSPFGTMTIDEDAAGSLYVGWLVPPLVRGEETTFVLEYTTVGALRVGEEEQSLSWIAVSGFGVPVQDARTFITLPDGVTAEQVEVEGATVQSGDAGQLVLEHDGPVAPGEAWQIRVSLPPQATNATVPLWQTQIAEAVAEAEQIREEIAQAEMRRARQQLLFGLIGALLLVGGLLLVTYLWYSRGRDRPVGVTPEYLTEPPSDLPPGIVAYLLDEKPTPKGVLASLFHLATLGLLRIRLNEPILLSRNWDEELVEGQAIETPAGDTVTIPDHMVRLFNGLFPHLSADPTPLNALAPHLPQLLPEVYYEMGEEANHFFDHAPTAARHRWLVIGQWIVLGGVGLAIAAAIFYVPSLGWVAVTPAVALALVGAALALISRWMPRRTDVGAEEAARWRSFEEYLRQMDRFGDQRAAQQILDRYFAYAVALDVEDVVLERAAQMGNRMPTWTRPLVIYRPQPQPLPSGSGRRDPVPPGPLRTRRTQQEMPELGERNLSTVGRETVESGPSLQGLSDTLARRLEEANSLLTGTLNKAVGEVSETPFQLVLRGAKGAAKLTWDATTTSAEILDDILDSASAGGGSSSYSGGRSSSRSSWGSSRSSSFGSRSSGFSGRSSSSRRSGGGGSRGFGR
jgi:hypothetical protein